MYIICSEAGQPLRDELSKSPQKILSSAFSEFLPKSEVALASSGEESHVSSSTDAPNNLVPTSSATSDAYFQGLALIKTLVKLMPGWLQSNRTVFDTLVLLWKSPARISRLQNEQELNLVQVSIGNPQFSLCSIIIVDFRCMT
jgi:transformation/transcription domain-associated protein